MRIDVIGRHMEVTEAIRSYAENKAAKLTKFFDGTQQVRVYVRPQAGLCAALSEQLRGAA